MLFSQVDTMARAMTGIASGGQLVRLRTRKLPCCVLMLLYSRVSEHGAIPSKDI